MSRNQVATRLTAKVSRRWLGGSTISAEVQRGDAPDEYTSPAFRSHTITLMLFRNALKEELSLIGSVGWGPECNQLRDDMQAVEPPMTNPVQMIMFDRKLRSKGCDPNAAPKEFRIASNKLRPLPTESVSGGGTGQISAPQKESLR